MRLQKMPYTTQSDWSKYDATQSSLLRTAVDRTLFECMYVNKIILDYKEGQADRYFVSVITANF